MHGTVRKWLAIAFDQFKYRCFFRIDAAVQYFIFHSFCQP